MNFKLTILIIILLIIIININKKTKEPFVNNNKLYLFYSFKSDFSMNVIPIWQQLKQLKIKHSDLTFYDINVTTIYKDKDTYNCNIIKTIEGIPVNSVPKIILKKKDSLLQYNGDFTLKDIIQFLKLNNIFVNYPIDLY